MKEGKTWGKEGRKDTNHENIHNASVKKMKEDEQKVTEEEVKNKELEQKIFEKENRIMELTDMLKRLQAEFENYRKRKDKEVEQIRVCSNQDIILKLLNIIDNFDLALNAPGDKGLRKGIELIYAQMLSTLENEGLKHIEENKVFDPKLHEVIICEKAECKEGQILEVFQKGYMLNGMVIRHAKVKVAKNGN